MSFLEFWGEQVDPGATGTVEFGTDHEACRWKPLVIARFVFTLILLPGLWWLALPVMPLPGWQGACLLVGGTLIYVALGYLVRPEPDLENIGIAGGLIDHPGRYSDDINRSLMSFQALLGPGRFVAESLIDFI